MFSGVDPSNPASVKSFRQALTKVLLKGFLSQEFITQFLDEYLDEFVKAFTHVSADRVNNYEVYEALGDTVVNACIMRYISEKYPEIVNIEWLTKLKNLFQSKVWLFRIAMVLGFEKWVRYSLEDFEVFYQVPNYRNTQEYQSIFEDTTEAFFGCFLECFIKSGYSFGAALQIAYYVLWWAFEEDPPEIRYEDVYDPVTRLKSVMSERGGTIETLEGHVWDYDGAGESFKDTSGEVVMYTHTYYGWVTSVKKKGVHVRGAKTTIIGQATAPGESEAKQAAALMALNNLKAYYESKGKVWKEYPKDRYLRDKEWNGFFGTSRQRGLKKGGAVEVNYKKPKPPPKPDWLWMGNVAPAVSGPKKIATRGSPSRPRADSKPRAEPKPPAEAEPRPKPRAEARPPLTGGLATAPRVMGGGRKWVPKAKRAPTGGGLWD